MEDVAGSGTSSGNRKLEFAQGQDLGKYLFLSLFFVFLTACHINAEMASLLGKGFPLKLESATPIVTNQSVIPITLDFKGIPVTDFNTHFLQISNATVANLTSQGSKYSFDLIPASEGAVSVQIPEGVLQAEGGEKNLASNVLRFEVDYTPPTVTIVGPDVSLGNAAKEFVWTVTYAGAEVVTLENSGISLTGSDSSGCSVTVTGTGETKTVTVRGCSGDGTMGICVGADTAKDSAGNKTLAKDGASFATVDNTAPTLAVTGPSPATGNSATPFVWTVTYSGADTITLSDSDISLGGTATAGCSKSVTGAGSTRTVTVSGCSGDGTVKINVAGNSAKDSAGNFSLGNSSATSATVQNTLNPADPAVQSDLFIATIDTTKTSSGSSANDQLTLPLVSGIIYNFAVDWGDGTVSQIKSWNAPEKTHTYAVAGVYDVKLLGGFPQLAFSGNGDLLKISDVKQWGTNRWSSMEKMFEGCSNLNSTAVDAPDLSQVTSLKRMFYGAQKFNGSIGHWNTSNVIDASEMFRAATIFNQPIGSWDVSKMKDINSMFNMAVAFNQPLGSWNTSSVTNMSYLFSGGAFNHPINGWDTSKVTNMGGMFSSNKAFNQNIGGWNTSSVTTMSGMFDDADAFNQNISSWNTSNVRFMGSMFRRTALFNQPIGSWNTSKVENMWGMFQFADAFDQPIGGWDTSNVMYMTDMFYYAKVFNQPIGGWNTSKVINMNSMFLGARAFNQPIGSWNTSGVMDMGSMFYLAETFNQVIGGWNTSSVTDMSSMFFVASSFDQPIGGWDTSSVTDMSSMFRNAVAFNRSIGGWNTTSVTTMNAMFAATDVFDQDIGGWNTSNVTDMDYMFDMAIAFNRNLSGWNVSSVVQRPPDSFSNGAASWVLPQPNW
ncbi:BspA family leucine-rich repeat surface protein [Bdellovibrio sp.]|uniref:BspA family leucine-rich repeat surface protein n=1 Tax=Bdellovibrio sp. TaxID=28201 RepID=UPI0039E4295F